MSLDVAAWAFNIVTSVGIIIVNKALMATYGFSFGMLYTCVEGLHFLVLVFHLSTHHIFPVFVWEFCPNDFIVVGIFI